MITKHDLDKLVLTAMAKAHMIERDFMSNYLGESKFFPYQETRDAEILQEKTTGTAQGDTPSAAETL